MSESPFLYNINEEEQQYNLKKEGLKYLRHWPWFLGTIILAIGIGVFYMRYTPALYESVAKIKIIDDASESNVAMDPLAFLAGGSDVNLDNEIEVLKSFRLLRQVVSKLNLDVDYYWEGDIRTTQIWNPPFKIIKKGIIDSLKVEETYRINISPTHLNVANSSGNLDALSIMELDSLPTNELDSLTIDLPFNIRLSDDHKFKNIQNITFKVILRPLKTAVLNLAKELEVSSENKNSDILSLSIKGESVDRSEAILNNVIIKLDQDGILDRQLISRRTLEVIDKRFVYLSEELDSIEIGKQDFKQANRLSFIEADAGLTMQRKSATEDEVIKLQNQLSLSNLLKETVVNQSEYSLLPADIGLENFSLNSLVAGYNELALERDKLLPNVGINHPALITLSGQLERGKINIIKSVNVYQAQLRTSLGQLTQQRNVAGALFSKLPEKEKTLRAIERQQDIKEKLFLLLLQKREEAEIALAATTPSLKVVDYALTNNQPISPKSMVVYPLALLFGMLLPLVVLFIRFSLDTKIHDREDIEKLKTGIPIIVELPFFKNKKMLHGPNERTVLAESFRILSTNINYFQVSEKEGAKGQVIYVTSAIKGEGKTLVALNLAMTYASSKKSVLLVGADLRNPQLQPFVNYLKGSKGLSDYLANPSMNWKECINDGFGKNSLLKVCFSGKIPPNAPALLSGKGFEMFIKQAKKEFDIIVVDTAPVLLVTDTLLISKYADITLMVARAGYTEKRLFEYSKEMKTNNKLQNMAFVLNGVGTGNSKDYNYGYGYGYGEQK